MNDRITILLVDDHALVREGLREILEMQRDMRVVGEAEDSASTVALATAEQPDIVLLDIEIPGADATTTVNQIRSCSPVSAVTCSRASTGRSWWSRSEPCAPIATGSFSEYPGKACGTFSRDRRRGRCPPANSKCSTWSRRRSATARSHPA